MKWDVVSVVLLSLVCIGILLHTLAAWFRGEVGATEVVLVIAFSVLMTWLILSIILRSARSEGNK